MSFAEQSVLERIRSAMPDASFDPPATVALIDAAESAVGVSFPDWLCEIYLACNGFRGPTDVRYLYPLDGREGVVEFTLFLRTEWSAPWLNRAIIFSDNGVGGTCTVHWAACDGRLIEWCYGDGDKYTVVDGDLYDVLRREQALWDDMEGDVVG